MKISKEKLKQMIKEELQKVMNETEQFPTDYDKDARKKHKDSLEDYARNTSGDQYARDEEEAAKKRAAKEKARGKVEESEELEEIKGAMGARMASLGDADDAIARVGAADDEEDDSYEADLYGPELSKDQEIDDMLERMGVDPLSKEGMDLRVAIKAAAEKNAKRYSDRRDDRLVGGDGNMHGDRLAQRKPVDRLTKKGKMFKTDADILKNKIRKGLGLEEGEQQMEELSESFRRFTKLPKATLKD